MGKSVHLQSFGNNAKKDIKAKALKQAFLVLLIVLLPSTAFAVSNDKTPEKKGSFKEEIKAYIQHHLKDSHDFYLGSYKDGDKKKYIGYISLPVILWDNGLVLFSSAKFKHGKAVVSKGSSHYKLYHGKIYKTDEAGTINYDNAHHAVNEKPLDLSMTKSVMTMLITALLMFLLFVSLARSYAKNGNVAKGIGRFFEPIILYIRDEIAIPSIGEEKHKKFVNYLLTIFFFIWFLNMLGLTPLGINVTGNIAITLGLAIFTFIITNFSGNKYYWKHIFWMPGVPVLMKIIMMPIELLGIFIKPFSLLIRLYANMQAGHIMLMTIIGLIYIFNNWIGGSMSFLLAFAISILELFVALLQAYIFTMLSSLYIGLAVADDH